MKPTLHIMKVMHARLEPKRHAFTYPALYIGIDLEELESGAADLGRLFRSGRGAVLSIDPSGYLTPGAGTLRERLMALLQQHRYPHAVGRVRLVTMPRYLGYSFNPVSFYYLYDDRDGLKGLVAEVNNTFGERHLYVLDRIRPAAGELHMFEAEADKAFHVSPFNDMKGRYRFQFTEPSGCCDVRINIEREGRTIFRSRLSGDARPLAGKPVFRALASYPCTLFLTMLRIHVQAMILFFRRKLRFYPKPVPSSPMTMQTRKPDWLTRIGKQFFHRTLGDLNRGHITIREPDGRIREAGTPGEQPAAELQIHDNRFYRRIATDGDIGLGESYMYGEWSSPDAVAVLSFLIANREALQNGHIATSMVKRLLGRIGHLGRANRIEQSRRNIHAHYDLSNDFFRTFLDASMMYSCAMFGKQGESLEQAQKNKLHAVIDQARIEPHHHVLEIGTGWGAFAIEAVRRTGCRVTTITVSEEQLELARTRVREAGLADRIQVEFRDYRTIEGVYDRIVSIEMIEAVGHRFLPEFFHACDQALKPDGLMVLQAITIPDQRYDSYRKNIDWIQKHIFPGGHLPSLAAMTEAMKKASRFNVESLYNIGPDYALTLREWRQRFEASIDRVRTLGFDDVFIRKWTYYLVYCEAAFATRTLNTLHVVCTRPNNPSLDQPCRRPGATRMQSVDRT